MSKKDIDALVDDDSDTATTLVDDDSEDATATEDDAAADATATEDEAAAVDKKRRTKKKMRMKLLIVFAVVLVVIVGAGSGLWVWHGQPEFCSAVCHSPMDPYVENYYGDDASLNVVAHRDAEYDVACLDCHDSDIGQQLNEAKLWLTGDFSDPPSVRRFGTEEFCNRCHDDGNAENGKDKAEIVAATENYQGSGRNPHNSHLIGLDCYNCHSVHRESKLYCTQCHDNVATPEAWK